MMVLSNKCKKCTKICNSIYFQHKFIDWTSGNDDIDKFIQNTQLSAHNDVQEALEWISYDRLNDIEYTKKNKFGKVYRANWIDGIISNWECESDWDYKNQDWKKVGTGNMFVNLKSLNILNNLTFEFINEV